MPADLSSPPPSRSSWYSNLLYSYGKANAALLAVLGVLFVAGVIFLADAEKPWGKVVQKRLDKGQELQLGELVITGVWWATLLNVVIVLALILAFRWWAPKGTTKKGVASRTVAPERPKAGKSKIRAFTLMTLLAMGFCAWQAWPKMKQSLWNDEEYAMRRFSLGEWEQDKNGQWEFEKTSWQETLFLSPNGNNHMFSSVMVRLSLDVWQSLTGATEDQFSEVVVRMPSFITALGSVALVAVLGYMLGIPAMGIAAAFLMILTPWFVHYAADGKGYSLLIFFLLLHFVGLIKALETDQLKWWLLFAIAQPLYLLSFVGSLYVAIATNLLVVAHLFFQKRFRSILTLSAFGFLGAIPVFVWASVYVPQILKYLTRTDALRLGLDWAWVRDLFSSLYLGYGFGNPFPESHMGTSWQDFVSSTPSWLHSGFALVVVPALIAVGIITAMLRSTSARVVLISPLLGALISFGHNAANNNPVVVWYFVFLLPFLALLICLAIYTISRNKTPVLWPLLIAVISIYGFSVSKATASKREHSRQPIREMASWIHEQSPDAMTATWGVSDLQSRSYLPKVNALKSVAELQALQTQAASNKQPLYVFYCGDTVTSQRDPELTTYVKTAGQYKLVKELKGLEELFSYRVYLWQPTPAPQPESQPPATVPSQTQSEAPAAAGS